MSDGHQFSRHIVALLQEVELDDAIRATAYCMAVVAGATADLNYQQAREFMREVLMPMAIRITHAMEEVEAQGRGRLQ